MSSASTMVPDWGSSSPRVPCAWMRPSPMMIIRSATASTSASRCEDNSTVPPRSAKSRRKSAHPAHALGVETVGGLVEDQDLGTSEQGMCQAKALSHPERVLAYTSGGGGFVETDDAQQRVDHRQRHAHGPGRNRQRLAAASSRVLGRRVEQQPDAPARVRQVAIAIAEHEGLSAVGLRESDKHSHRRGLAGAVGAEEAGDGSRLAAEGDVGDDCSVSTALGQGVGGDHAGTLATLAVMEGLGARRAAATIAALTARIETRPTHWRVSPMASPQYGLDGPISTGTRWKNV